MTNSKDQEQVKGPILNVFKRIEQLVFEEQLQKLKAKDSYAGKVGACGLAAFIGEEYIYIANLGDSQAVLLCFLISH